LLFLLFQTSGYKIKQNLLSKQYNYEETTRQQLKIDYLINNAGFGTYGFFAISDWEKEQQMINLNISALCQFTPRALVVAMARKIMG
jgi:short-subunit dehydrogenase